jgi:hypothetical protein
MYDGWSNDSTHYIGVVGTFMRSFRVFQKGESAFKSETEIVLLSVAPMRHTNGDDGEDDDDDEQMPYRLAVTFNSKNQSEHLKKVLQVFGVQFDEWCVCLIGDNAAVNIKTAELCKTPHVGCKNHKINFEVNVMLAVDNQLTRSN